MSPLLAPDGDDCDAMSYGGDAVFDPPCPDVARLVAGADVARRGQRHERRLATTGGAASRPGSGHPNDHPDTDGYT
jgi:hypothetical protein